MGEYGVTFQNEPIGVSEGFARQEIHFRVGSKVLEFDPRSAHLRLEREGDGFALKVDPLRGRIGWTVRTAAGGQQDA